MEIIVSEFNERALRLALAGDLDIAAAEHLDLPLAVLAGSGGVVIVDMRKLDRIASIGIRHLVFAARRLGRDRGQLILLSPNPHVMNALKTARVDDLLPIVRSEDEARARLEACSSNRATDWRRDQCVGDRGKHRDLDIN
jgi:anti-anti-sigma factor